MNNRILRSILTPVAMLSVAACAELDVSNPNNPDISRALASPADVAKIGKSAVNSWYLAATHYEPTMALEVTADVLTANFGNFGMRFNNVEPRIAYNNISSGADALVSSRPWDRTYGALGAANDALRAIAGGTVIPGASGTEKTQAAALFAQAASLTNLALLFDKSFVVTERSDMTKAPELVPYTAVRDSALKSWDALITLATGKTWSWDADAMPLTVPQTAANIARIANTMAARTLMLTARTAQENSATSWARVLSYADKGLTGTGLTDIDFSVVSDGGNVWYSYVTLYGNYDSWLRVDQRLINRMAPNVPVKYAGTNVAPQSNDRRLTAVTTPCTGAGQPAACLTGITSDYVYLGTVLGDPARGIYMQSPYYHRRYRDISFSVATANHAGKAMPYVLAAENDLIIAEALARTGGDLNRAATLVNKTRVTRGGLAPVAATQAALLDAISYEREVELLNTNALGLFDRRRTDSLQPLSFRQLPIPGKELETLQLPYYTFGGN
ncbi:MAG TPA: RagB/SusD family nutrient uptake outer membrane protein [Gemmatimonas sp.]|uniref:RagB/SusD family nutrient uptake outer membrane protein n=1 Tax=Gemmatimonas sp. TaxID=1962908 RepID=UPI002ED92B57